MVVWQGPNIPTPQGFLPLRNVPRLNGQVDMKKLNEMADQAQGMEFVQCEYSPNELWQ